MSAFVVDPTHIDALLTAADAWGILRHPRVPLGLSHSAIGAMFVKVNNDSVNATYNEIDAPPPYEFSGLGINIWPVVVLKAVQGFEYQSSNHPGWRGREGVDVEVVRLILDELTKSAVRKLPGYGEAPWVIGAADGDIFGGRVTPIFA